jgi:hypothetical protein
LSASEAGTHSRLEQTRTDLPDEQRYSRMSLNLRLMQLKTVLEWLDGCQQLSELEKHAMTATA